MLLALGQKTEYQDKYDNSLLFPISRAVARQQLGILDSLPFQGFDIWNCYELSWLGHCGKPEVKILEFSVNADSPYIVESKSLKLYLNSFSNTRFDNVLQIKKLIEQDLTSLLKSPVIVYIKDLTSYNNTILKSFSGVNLDSLEIIMDDFDISKNIPQLSSREGQVEESLCSNLLKSNCLVTNQPDWASIQIIYQGRQIDHNSLLKYLVSFRNHNEFHEQCVERIFCEINKFCHPNELTVYARYTRRGGIDINPIRSNRNIDINRIDNSRHVRQ